MKIINIMVKIIIIGKKIIIKIVIDLIIMKVIMDIIIIMIMEKRKEIIDGKIIIIKKKII